MRPASSSLESGNSTRGIDTLTSETLTLFRQALEQRYGPRLKAVCLFGSRARGDGSPDSDADVAVFVDRVVDPLQEQLDLVDLGHPLLLSNGILIEPWVFDADALGDPRDGGVSHLLRAIKREGRPI